MSAAYQTYFVFHQLPACKNLDEVLNPNAYMLRYDHIHTVSISNNGSPFLILYGFIQFIQWWSAERLMQYFASSSVGRCHPSASSSVWYSAHRRNPPTHPDSSTKYPAFCGTCILYASYKYRRSRYRQFPGSPERSGLMEACLLPPLISSAPPKLNLMSTGAFHSPDDQTLPTVTSPE